MKEKLLNFTIVLIASLLVGCGNSKPPKEPSDIKALKSEKAIKASAVRLEHLKEAARSIAAQGGLSWRSRQLNLLLTTQKRNLDNIYNFGYLILNKNVLPPILVEGRNTLNLADSLTIRASDHDYQIIQPPRFITTPPNWRNYIWMAYKKPEEIHATLLPQNSVERRVWNQYTRIGWREGAHQADEIFAANLARLHRDFEGMILYRKLLAQNMVTPPYVSQADLGITGDNSNLHINDRVLRITAIPRLQMDSKQWRPIISTKDEPRAAIPLPYKNDKLGGKGKLNH